MQITDNHRKPDKHRNTEIPDKRGKPGNANTCRYFVFGNRDANGKDKARDISNCSNMLMISDYQSKTDNAVIHNDAYTEQAQQNHNDREE